MANWPAGLPHPLIGDFQAMYRMPHIVTEMESGPPRRSLRTSDYLATGPLSMYLDDTQRALFYQLIEDSAHGADWINGVPIDTGSGVVGHAIRITNPVWRVMIPGKLWRVTMQYETRDRN